MNIHAQASAGPVRFRTVEYHEVTAGGALPDPGHFDGGSLVTVDVMLRRPGVDFEGGGFVGPCPPALHNIRTGLGPARIVGRGIKPPLRDSQSNISWALDPEPRSFPPEPRAQVGPALGEGHHDAV